MLPAQCRWRVGLQVYEVLSYGEGNRIPGSWARLAEGKGPGGEAIIQGWGESEKNKRTTTAILNVMCWAWCDSHRHLSLCLFSYSRTALPAAATDPMGLDQLTLKGVRRRYHSQYKTPSTRRLKQGKAEKEKEKRKHCDGVLFFPQGYRIVEICIVWPVMTLLHTAFWFGGPAPPPLSTLLKKIPPRMLAIVVENRKRERRRRGGGETPLAMLRETNVFGQEMGWGETRGPFPSARCGKKIKKIHC